MQSPSRSTWIALALALLGLAAWGGRRWLDAARERAPQDPPLPPSVGPAPAERLERREVAPSSPEARPPEVAGVPAGEGGHLAELNNQAVAALERGELDEALALLEQCVAADPLQAVFARNLAETLTRLAVREHERIRPCEPCLEQLSRAVELAPERADLAKLLERWKREAQTEADFHRVQSQHFELAHEVWRGGLLDRSADLLEALELHYAELAALFDVRPAEAGRPRIPVSLYRPAEFSRITGLAEWAGASFDGVIRAPVAEERDLGPAFDELLRHELIHAFVRESGGRAVPGWLNEGLAQWFQRTPQVELERARLALRGGELIALERMEGPLTGLSESALVARAYAQCLAFCAFIDREYGRPVLLAMVAGCSNSTSAGATFERWTSTRLSEALARFAAEL